ncbi:vacuolar iron transporter homolog 2-like [Pistacia vera]|uniref:vacuolar iron transporter homolog 2-like n=1 Tax=Pistacia vera TaxID=55513 RepID=UPI00126316C7|nr:vacuolar iron transporter homolog 2-like [Pistacia vera]
MSVSQLQKPHSNHPFSMASPQTLQSHIADHKNYQRKERVRQGQWIRAAILGANDGLLSTTSLMLGVGAAKEDRRSMVLSGLAGAIAGACSMAVGEFVSVSTQRDIEKASAAHCSSETDIAGQDDHVIKLDITASSTTIKETKLSETDLGISNVLTPTRNICCQKMSSDMITESRTSRLPQIFSPGRSPMMKVIIENSTKTNTTKITSPAVKSFSKDAVTNTVQLWEEKGEEVLPNPLKAATASALAFLCGSFVPLVPAILFASYLIRIVVIAILSSIALVLFGCFGAHLGGSSVRISATRVLVGGWIAMGITYGLLKPFDSRS